MKITPAYILCSKYICFFSLKTSSNKNGEMMRKIDLIRSLLVYVAASDKKSDRSLDQNIDILTIDISTQYRCFGQRYLWTLNQSIDHVFYRIRWSIFLVKNSCEYFNASSKKPENIVIGIELPSIPISSLWVSLWYRYTSFYFAMEEPIWLNYVALG